MRQAAARHAVEGTSVRLLRYARALIIHSRQALETYRILTVPPCPHKFCDTCGANGCSMCSIRLPAKPLFAASECHLCRTPGEFDYLVCPACLEALAAAVQPERLVENAVFVAAGSPEWWRARGSIRCDLIPPVGQYIVAGVAPLLAQRRDVFIEGDLIRRASDRRTAPRSSNIFQRLVDLASRSTQTVALDIAAANFSERELADLLDAYPVVYLHSSKPSFIILANELE